MKSKSATRFQESRIKHQESITPAQALGKIQKYCAYQERSHLEVKYKLQSFGLRSDAVDEIISRLITHNFLNEERFAKAFAGGKFRMKKWGRNKIVYELEGLGLTKNCIARGLKEIDSSEYIKTLRSHIQKKALEVSETNPFAKRNKIARFAISKGYEPELVWGTVMELMAD